MRTIPTAGAALVLQFFASRNFSSRRSFCALREIHAPACEGDIWTILFPRDSKPHQSHIILLSMVYRSKQLQLIPDHRFHRFDLIGDQIHHCLRAIG